MSGKVEYKETKVFDLFPEYEYTKEQKARLILFHDYHNHIKKAINYAANFDVPNKLCFVYIVGQPKDKKIFDALEETNCSDNVCVLTSPFPEDGIKLYKEFDAMRKSYRTRGLWDEDTQTPVASWYDDHAKYRKVGLKVNKEMYQELLAQNEADLELLHQYRRLQKASRNTHFKKWRLYRRGHLTKPFEHKDLDRLITKIFSEGTEAKDINTYAALSPSSLEPAIKYALNDEYNKKLGFTIEDNNAAVKAICKVINKLLAEDGYVKLTDIHKIVASPPFGFRLSGYGAACVAKALLSYSHRSLFFYDSCSSWKLDKCLTLVCKAILEDASEKVSNRKMYETYCLYLESHPHKVVKQIMAKVFDTKILMPGDYMALRIIHDIILPQYRLPFDCVDKRLLDLVVWNVPWWNKAEVEKLAEQLENKVQELIASYQQYKQEDAAMPPSVRQVMSDYSFMWTKDSMESIEAYARQRSNT